MSRPPLVDAGTELIEREQESAVLDALVDRLRDGGGAVVLRGEAGIGKSALLLRVRLRAEANGARALGTVGVESEAEVAFSGLHQLLRRLIGALGQLPASRWQALEAALGLGVETEPDPYRVAVAAFQLICEVADSVPLVLIVDDAQWLDRSTCLGDRLLQMQEQLVHCTLDDARARTVSL